MLFRKINALRGLLRRYDAGTGIAGYSIDGTSATSAKLNNPVGLTFDKHENLIFADVLNSRIREVVFHPTLNTVDLLVNSCWELFPNPNSGSFTITYSSGSNFSGKLNYSVCDFLGSTLFTRGAYMQDGRFSEAFNIHVSNGIYVFRMVNEEINIAVPFVVKDH